MSVTAEGSECAVPGCDCLKPEAVVYTDWKAQPFFRGVKGAWAVRQVAVKVRGHGTRGKAPGPPCPYCGAELVVKKVSYLGAEDRLLKAQLDHEKSGVCRGAAAV